MGKSFVIDKYYDVPDCLFCGGNTKLSVRKTGTFKCVEKPDWNNIWVGIREPILMYSVLCNKCHSRGPLKSTIEDAIESYVIS